MKLGQNEMIVKNLCHDGVGDGTSVRRLEPRHPFRQNTKHVDVQVLSDIINIYSKQKITKTLLMLTLHFCNSILIFLLLFGIVIIIVIVIVVVIVIIVVIVIVIVIVVVIVIINDFAVVLHGSKPDQHLASKTAARSHSILLPKGSIHHHHRRHRCRRCRCLRRRRRHRCIIIIIAVVIIKARAHSKVLPKSSNHDRWG